MTNKNTKIHFIIETKIKESYQKEADKLNMSLAELLRQKLMQPHILVRLEEFLEKIPPCKFQILIDELMCKK